jgi:hypothetical protein
MGVETSDAERFECGGAHSTNRIASFARARRSSLGARRSVAGFQVKAEMGIVPIVS